MGQTLTHGVYLPDEGERNCYDGLAANWQLLDGAVGTVAEHTTALAGKANAVHTHTKADITDFPAYGNTAGTICEGNDSRLSDARTPVAHTHTKSDVTDLLNSNFIPSANNSYDLGSSSYQWNNLYAKNYYYNGTAWGLDKSNVWTSDNAFSHNILIRNSTVPKLLLRDERNNRAYNNISGGGITRLESTDVNSKPLSRVSSIFRDTGASLIELLVFTEDSSGNEISRGVSMAMGSDGANAFRPNISGSTDLGNSLQKWKTLNGINPGALSLPNSPGGSGTVNVNYYDLSSIVTIRDGSGVNSYQPVCDGWIAINSFATWIQIANDTTLVCVTGAIGADGFGQCYLPVRKNDSIRIVINQTNTNFQSFKLIPCQGNV